jgi:peptidoglycan/LPS O-acetylase OafA/YrhL
LINPYKIYFSNLDALRFFAFFAVFTAHITHVISPEFAGHIRLTLLFPYFQLGVLGVNFFFVLSAFLITYLIYEERTATHYFSFTKYYIRRTLRIWPLYFLIVFIGFVIIPVFKHLQGIQYTETANIWYYVFFISNIHMIYLGEPFSPILAVLWSIAVEEQFYVFWPFLMTFFSKGREVILFFLLIAGSLAFRYFHLNNGAEIYLHPFSIMSDFGIGGLLAYFSFKKNNLFIILSGMGRVFIVLFYLAFILLLYFNFQLFQNPLLYVVERCVFGLFFAFIIFEQCFCKKSLFKFGDIKLFGELGKRSYGLYCYHQIGILMALNVLRYLTRCNLSLNELYLEPLLALAITIILAYLSYKYFETPFLKLKSRFGF